MIHDPTVRPPDVVSDGVGGPKRKNEQHQHQVFYFYCPLEPHHWYILDNKMVRVFLKGGVWKNSEDEILKAAVQKYGKQVRRSMR